MSGTVVSGRGKGESEDQWALEARGLGKKYRRGWALREESFRIPAGRVCGLVGPNGAGKAPCWGSPPASSSRRAASCGSSDGRSVTRP